MRALCVCVGVVFGFGCVVFDVCVFVCVCVGEGVLFTTQPAPELATTTTFHQGAPFSLKLPSAYDTEGSKMPKGGAGCMSAVVSGWLVVAGVEQ